MSKRGTCGCKGCNHYRSGAVTRDDQCQVAPCWEKALALDPGLGAAQRHARLHAFRRCPLRLVGRPRRRRSRRRRPMSSGRWRSIPRIPTPIAALSGVLLLKSRFDEAAEAARKAVKLGPNLPDVLVFASYVLTCCRARRRGDRPVREGDDAQPDLSGQLSRRSSATPIGWPAAATTRSRRSGPIAREARATGWPTW